MLGFQTVYREGDRIRATNGIGYNDRVPDAEIHQDIDAPSGRGDVAESRAFGRAVLAIRAYERLLNAPAAVKHS